MELVKLNDAELRMFEILSVDLLEAKSNGQIELKKSFCRDIPTPIINREINNEELVVTYFYKYDGYKILSELLITLGKARFLLQFYYKPDFLDVLDDRIKEPSYCFSYSKYEHQSGFRGGAFYSCYPNQRITKENDSVSEIYFSNADNSQNTLVRTIDEESLKIIYEIIVTELQQKAESKRLRAAIYGIVNHKFLDNPEKLSEIYEFAAKKFQEGVNAQDSKGRVKKEHHKK